MESIEETIRRDKKIANLKDIGYSTKEIYEMGFKNKYGNALTKRYLQECIKKYSPVSYNGRITDTKLFTLRDVENIILFPDKKDKIVRKRTVDHYKKVNQRYLNTNFQDGIRYNWKLRATVFERDNYECVECNSTLGLECHHIYGKNDFKDFKDEVDNCVTLCYKCHRAKHY